jgi:beta-glucosidase-like glycosyl hydrolase
MKRDAALEKLVGRILCLKIEGNPDRVPGENDRVADLLSKGRAGGVIFFRGDKSDTPEVISQMRAAAAGPIYAASDLEDGAGQHVIGATPFPSNMASAATGDESAAFKKGEITALEARALGIDVVYAPCVDVSTNPLNPIIGVRSFGEDPAEVARFGASFLKGLQAGGAADCIKHYPGHGDTELDSHITLPVLRHDRKRIDAVDLFPFKKCIEAGSLTVMVGHLAVPALTGDEGLPATLSKKICTDILRKELGFKGVLFTDAMIMGALVKKYPASEAAITAVEAGCDVVLMPVDSDEAHAAICGAVKSGRIKITRIEEAVARVDALVKWIADRPPKIPLSSVGSAQNRAAASEIAARSITLIRDPRSLIPLKNAEKTYLAVFDVDGKPDTGRTVFRAFVFKNLHPAMDRVTMDTTPADFEHVLAHAAKAEAVAALLYSEGRGWKGRAGLPEEMRAMLIKLFAVNEKTAAVSLASPYILHDLPENVSLIAAYGAGAPAEEALGKALLGAAPINGKLPVTIENTAARGGVIMRKKRK